MGTTQSSAKMAAGRSTGPARVQLLQVDGNTFVVEVPSSAKVEQLLQVVEETSGVPVANQMLHTSDTEERMIRNAKLSTYMKHSSPTDEYDLQVVLLLGTDERSALETLYKSTEGENWRKNSNWMDGDIKTWYGVKTRLYDDGVDHVVELNLPANNIKGSLEKVNFESFPHLEQLWLSFNEIHGRIPESLCRCSKLQKLYIQSTKIQGLPTSFTQKNLPELRYIGVAHQLGDSSAFWGSFTGLTVLT